MSTFGIVLFFLIILLNAFLGFFFGEEKAFLATFVQEQGYLVPIFILSSMFLLNRWLGHLILLDTEGRSAFRLVYPSLSFVVLFLNFTPQLLIRGSAFLSLSVEFILLTLVAILFVALVLGTKGDERSPSLMLALAFILAGLSVFKPKLLLLSPIIFYLFYELKSLSWRNVFAFLWGIILVPLFLFPYLWYTNEGDFSFYLRDWIRSFLDFSVSLELNYLLLATMILTALAGQVSYSISSAKLSIAQRMYLSTWNALMWSSLLYIIFLDSTNAFVLALFVLCSSLGLARAVVALNKKMYYFFLFVYTLLMVSNIFFLNS